MNIRHRLDRAWSQLQAGWNHLVARAGDALTRFRRRAEDAPRDDAQSRALLQASPEWGLLAAEVHESGDEITVRLELPGMDPDDIDVQIVERTLVVSGHKRVRRERSDGRYHVTECAYGRFERLLPLPAEVDASRAEAGYRRGVLTLVLPKTERERVRRIPVNRA